MSAPEDSFSGAACRYQRLLALEESYNVRDVGGYPTNVGSRTRWGVLLRADNLDRLTAASRQTVLRRGVKTIIDLRDGPEVRRHPDVFSTHSAVRYVNVPLVRVDASIWQADLSERYILMLQSCTAQLRTIVETMAASNFPLIVHCTAGKDRTGLVVAVLLDLVGVAAESIAADYALSEGCLAPFFTKVRFEVAIRGGDLERFDRNAKAAPETICRALDHLAENFGGAAGYLRAIGVAEGDRDRLCAVLTDLRETRGAPRTPTRDSTRPERPPLART